LQSFPPKRKPEDAAPAPALAPVPAPPDAASGRSAAGEVARAGTRRRGFAQASAGAPAAANPDFITALARGLQVLRCYRAGTTSLGNLDLARATGLPKATISRITYTLTELGYLRYDRASGRYQPGPQALALGAGLLAGLDVREQARPAMQLLARDTGAAVALGTFDGDAMAYIEAVHGSNALYLRLPVGYRVGMDSAMGRAYLATVPPAALPDLLASLPAGAPAPALVARCREELAETGCCFALGEWQSGINAAAAPFETMSGEGTFVISCGGPASLLPEAVLRERVAPELQRMARTLALGAAG